MDGNRTRTARPIRVIQFGEGNFLRAFVDYMLDVANERGAFYGHVVIVKPTDRGNLDKFVRQDNFYTVLTRGRANGQVVDERRLIGCVERCLSPYDDPDGFWTLAELPDVRFVVSNTTEAGIALTGGEALGDRPCASFPGKLTQWLYARWKHFGGDPEKGVTVLPVELIDDNAGTLRRYVLELCGKWRLEAAFEAWLETACRFHNTLVDRIVTGYPADAAAVCERLGYQDALLDVCEPFALWVIECNEEDAERLTRELPLQKAGLPVVLTRDLTPYHERKVRLLNGAHTSSVLAAYLAGEDIVRGMMHNPLLRAYLDRAVYGELAPTVALPAADVKAFADSVMERFDNPFIDHALTAIALNSVSKWRARVLPGVRAYLEKTGRLPRCLTFSWAALAAFYTPVRRNEDGTLVGKRDGNEYTVRDDRAAIDFFWENRSAAPEKLLRDLAGRVDFWGEDLNGLNGFVDQAIVDLKNIRALGVKDAIRRAMEREI